MEEKGDKKTSTIATAQDLQALLDNGVNLNINTTPLGPEIAADGHYITEATWNRYRGTINQNRYTWTNAILYETVTDWNGPYFAVLNCNVVLTEAERFAGDARIPNIKAQAQFFRAMAFLNLAVAYAPAYKESSAGSDVGIPIRLSDDVNEPSVRSSVKKTYEQILFDLNACINNLPTVAPVITQPSKPAALALLARTYLYMGDYSNAGKYADQCLQLANQLLTYDSLPAGKGFIGVNKEVLLVCLVPAAREVTRDYLIDQSLVDLYEENDKRRSQFFVQRGGGFQFIGTYGNSGSDLFAGVAVDEVYLIRAECYARENKVEKAMETLNNLVRTRYAKKEDGTTTYVDQTAVDKIDALRKIFLERRKQLILRNIRWADLKRLNLESEFAITISRSIAGQTYTLEPNSYKYNFPVPAEIIRASSIPQNPGWE